MHVISYKTGIGKPFGGTNGGAGLEGGALLGLGDPIPGPGSAIPRISSAKAALAIAAATVWDNFASLSSHPAQAAL